VNRRSRNSRERFSITGRIDVGGFDRTSSLRRGGGDPKVFGASFSEERDDLRQTTKLKVEIDWRPTKLIGQFPP
jgi:hypothetical protein